MLDFLGIGAQKAGTTWLYEMLALHPHALFPGGKEVHFWNRRSEQGVDWHDWNAKKERGVDWYRSLFEAPNDGMRRGEITPAYATLSKPTIANIAELNPNVRMLYILRNPIERAWSSALLALRKAQMTLNEASDQWFIDHFRSAGSLRRGDYEACLRRWRSVFPPGQILVLRYETLRDEPLRLLTQCADHLGIDQDFYSTLPHEALTRKVLAGPGHPIRPTLLPVLEELYEPKIRALGTYLGWNLAHWCSGLEPERLTN